MGFRDTGETVVEKKKVVEQFCDECGDTIPESHHPDIDLYVTPLHTGGDGSDGYSFCSFGCLSIFAGKEK